VRGQQSGWRVPGVGAWRIGEVTPAELLSLITGRIQHYHSFYIFIPIIHCVTAYHTPSDLPDLGQWRPPSAASAASSPTEHHHVSIYLFVVSRCRRSLAMRARWVRGLAGWVFRSPPSPMSVPATPYHRAFAPTNHSSRCRAVSSTLPSVQGTFAGAVVPALLASILTANAALLPIEAALVPPARADEVCLRLHSVVGGRITT